MRSIIMLITVSSIVDCLNKKIEITVEHIINPNWDEQANAIKINKLRLKKDSSINPYLDLSQVELLDKLEDDTSFLFVGNIKYNGKKYSDRKVYFNKSNGFFGGQIKVRRKRKR